MAAPFIFIETNKVKSGKLEEFKAWFGNYLDTTVEPNEPRLLSFGHMWTPWPKASRSSRSTRTQESMVHHMGVITKHVATAYVDSLERDSRWQIYGHPAPDCSGSSSRLAATK